MTYRIYAFDTPGNAKIVNVETFQQLVTFFLGNWREEEIEVKETWAK